MVRTLTELESDDNVFLDFFVKTNGWISKIIFAILTGSPQLNGIATPHSGHRSGVARMS
jgi:hypothetical protein